MESMYDAYTRFKGSLSERQINNPCYTWTKKYRDRIDDLEQENKELKDKLEMRDNELEICNLKLHRSVVLYSKQ